MILRESYQYQKRERGKREKQREKNLRPHTGAANYRDTEECVIRAPPFVRYHICECKGRNQKFEE